MDWTEAVPMLEEEDEETLAAIAAFRALTADASFPSKKFARDFRE